MTKLESLELILLALQEAHILREDCQSTQLRDQAIKEVELLIRQNQPKKVKEFRNGGWSTTQYKCTKCGEIFRSQHSAHFHESQKC